LNSSEKESINTIFIGSYNQGEILSGPEKVTKRIFQEFSKLNKTLLISYFQDGKKYGYCKKLFGQQKIDSFIDSEVLITGVFRMIYLMMKIRPKYIHILSFNRFAAFVYIIKLFYRVKIYYTVNGVIIHENKVYDTEKGFVKVKNRIVENIIIYSSDRIFILSEFSKSIILKYFKPNNFVFLKAINGLDKCFFKNNYLPTVMKEVNSVVFIGDVNRKEKGFHFFVKALKLINTKLNIYIVSDYSWTDNFNLNDNIKLIYQNKLPPEELVLFLRNKNIILSVSECDSFNISILEALSCGLNPIFTRQTGLSEYLQENFSTSIIEFGDINALVDLLNLKIKNNLQFKNDFNAEPFLWNNVFKNYYLKYYYE